MAGAVRLELTTYGFGDRCSTSWAIPLWGDLWGSNPCMLEPQSSVLTASPKPPYKFYKETREPRDSRVPLRQLPTLPRRLQRSTLGLRTLNCCVRNGNRWNRSGIITAYLSVVHSKLHRRNHKQIVRLVSQALDRLVLVSCTHCCASTPSLSTLSSSRGLTSL